MKSIWILVVAVLAMVVSIVGWAVNAKASKLAYIELSTVFNEFEMTKQYKAKLEATVSARKAIIDSLELNLKSQSRSFTEKTSTSDPAVQQFMYNKEYYLDKAKQFEEDNLALKQQYDTEINKQITQYVKEYGQSKGYRFIYGAEGSGTLMYADDKDNVTKELLEYINNKYKGIAK